MPDLAVIQELARRGKLPDEYRPLYDEALRRGLVQGQEQQPGTMGDIAKSAGSGLVRGVAGIAGLGGDVQSGVDWAVRKAGSALGFEPKQIPADAEPSFLQGLISRTSPPTSRDVTSAIENNVTGPLYEPQTRAGKFVGTAAEFLPAAAAGPGTAARRIAGALGAGVGSEAAGQATEGSSLEPYARVAGALAGGMAPALGMRGITPLPIPPERQRMVDALHREGVYPTAGQASGRKGLQYLESELGGGPIGHGATNRLLEGSAQDFTRAALRRIGETADRATPEVMDRALNRIGQQFDDVAARNALRPDMDLVNDLGAAQHDYIQLVPPSQRAPAVDRLVDDILGAATGSGNIPGDVYQAYRSRFDKLARGARADPQLSEALFGIRNALDDAMERSIQAAGNPADITAWREARNQYRNYIVLEKAAVGGGEDAAMGIISPARLRQAVVGQHKRSYVRGEGDFAELARAGQATMTPLPQSGTAPRLAARAIPGTLGAMVGSGAGPYGAGMGAVAGMMAPYVAGRALMSRPVQSYLMNQSVPGAAGGIGEAARRAALIEAIMAPRQLSAPQPR